MSTFSANRLFRQFLETRAPLLFLIGSLALGILSNAVYELITTTFGATPVFLITLVISAIVVLAFVVWGVRRIARAIEGRQAIGQPAPDRQTVPHGGLILPVGLSKPGPELDIIDWHGRNGALKHCWLIITPQVRGEAADKLGDLMQRIQDRNALPHPIEVDDALKVDQLYATMTEVLREAGGTRGAAPLIADITSGNKPMTAGLLLACLEQGVPMQYWHAPRDRLGRPLASQSPSAMEIVVSSEPGRGHGRHAA